MAQRYERLTVNVTGCGFDFHSRKWKIFGVEAKRGFFFLPLDTQCLQNSAPDFFFLQNSAENAEWNVLTLGSLWLPCLHAEYSVKLIIRVPYLLRTNNYKIAYPSICLSVCPEALCQNAWRYGVEIQSIYTDQRSLDFLKNRISEFTFKKMYIYVAKCVFFTVRYQMKGLWLS